MRVWMNCFLFNTWAFYEVEWNGEEKVPFFNKTIQMSTKLFVLVLECFSSCCCRWAQKAAEEERWLERRSRIRVSNAKLFTEMIYVTKTFLQRWTIYSGFRWLYIHLTIKRKSFSSGLITISKLMICHLQVSGTKIPHRGAKAIIKKKWVRLLELCCKFNIF